MSEPGPKPTRCNQCGDKPVHWSNAAQDWTCLTCHLIAVKRGSHPPHVPEVAMRKEI